METARLALLALAALGAACTEKNPFFCSRDAECASGVCIDALFECAACDCTGDAPVCDPSDGACRACAGHEECPAAAPFCHPDGSCRGCVEHEDCASDVCDRDQGRCVAEDEVIYADALRGADGPDCGSEGEPCLTVTGEEGALSKLEPDRLWVRLRPGTYGESIDFLGIAARLVGEGGVVIAPEGGGAGAYVEGEARVLLENLAIEGASGGATPGVICAGRPGRPELTIREVSLRSTDGAVQLDGCAARIEGSRISGNQGPGVQARGESELEVRRSRILGNGDEGLLLERASFEVVNTIVADHPNGIRIEDASPEAERTRVLEHVTIAGDGSIGIQCSFGSAAHTFRNNIVFGPGQPSLGSCNHTSSLIDGSPAESGNLDDDPRFVDPEGGDFHIEADSPCVDAASPASEVTADIDGQRRPQGSGPDIGADEVPAG